MFLVIILVMFNKMRRMKVKSAVSKRPNENEQTKKGQEKHEGAQENIYKMNEYYYQEGEEEEEEEKVKMNIYSSSRAAYYVE